MSDSTVELDSEQSLLADITGAAREEAAAAARKMALAKRYVDLRSDYAAAAPESQFTPETARRSAVAEVALATVSSYATVSGWIQMSEALERRPEVRAAFAAGIIGAAAVRTICDHTAGVPAAVMLVIESTIVAAAQRLAPRPLGVEIDRLLMETDPEAAERAAKRACKSRRVTTQRMPRGMGAIRAVLTAAEITEIGQLLRQVVKTVCPLDRRDMQQRYADAYMTLMRGQTALRCTCDNDNCPARRNPITAEPDVHLNISCDVDTLLGLGRNPAILEGYGCLDAATARELATSATWRAIIHAAERLDGTPTPTAVETGLASSASNVAARETLNPLLRNLPPTAITPAQHARMLREYFGGVTNSHVGCQNPGIREGNVETVGGTTVPTTGGDCQHASPPTNAPATITPAVSNIRSGRTVCLRPNWAGAAENSSGTTTPAAHRCRTPFGAADNPHPTASAQLRPTEARATAVTVARTRHLPAGTVFDSAPCGTRRPAATRWQQIITDLHAMDPENIRALDPRGHGGFDQPPAGALTYQPGAALAAAVRLRDATCRHPGCTVPAIDCQIDHVVPFRHRDRSNGGWSVLANLQCLCSLHHSLKTAKEWHYQMLGFGIVHTWNSHGQHGFSLPARRAAVPW